MLGIVGAKFQVWSEWNLVDKVFVRRSGSSLQERKNFLVLLRRKVGPDAHVHHHDIPLRRAVVAR